jgi:sirohydrochlorin cobaltochelatase
MQHIILTAFGTSESAKSTYRFLESHFSTRFPNAQLHWSISTPSTNRPANSRQPEGKPDLTTLLKNFAAEERARVIVQSLHLTPGLEFHRVAGEVRKRRPDMTIGMPLLGTPEDFNRVSDCLLPLFPDATDHGVLLIGHGTTHPSWTIYPVMEQVLRAKTRSPVFVATLQHFPDSRSVIDHMVASAANRWLIIPLLLTTGNTFSGTSPARNPTPGRVDCGSAISPRSFTTRGSAPYRALPISSVIISKMLWIVLPGQRHKQTDTVRMLLTGSSFTFAVPLAAIPDSDHQGIKCQVCPPWPDRSCRAHLHEDEPREAMSHLILLMIGTIFQTRW